MPSISIAYFSQTGTTQTIAEHIARGLGKTGVKPTLSPMTEMAPHRFAEADILGLGLPVYMFRPPFLVMDFLKALPDLTGKSFFLFVLFGTHPGSTASTVRQILLQKGATELGLHYSMGADLFAGYLKEGTLFSPDRPSQADKEASESFGESLLARFHNGQPLPEVDLFGAGIPDLIERAFTHRFLARHLYRHTIVVQDELCSSCGLCANLCPTGNITMEEGKPRIGKECLLCLTCQLRCPKGAFWSPFTSWVFAPVMKFNIWNGKRRGVEHVPVTWEGGKVKRI